MPSMYGLTYDLWNLIIEDAVDAYSPLVEAMKNASESIYLTKSLADELKEVETMEIEYKSWHFLLTIELYDDDIDGFKISLEASETIDSFERLIERLASIRGVKLEEIKNFGVENGLNFSDDIFDMIDVVYSVDADESEDKIVFKFVIFDSQDIDNTAKIEDENYKFN
jgi:hypothetical protein